MNVTTKQVTMLTIISAPRLDPIRVVFENREPGKGRIIIECFGAAWSAWWGAMGGGSTVEEFVERAPTDYIVSCMQCTVRPLMQDREQAHLTRIVDAVRQAIREQLARAAVGDEVSA